MKLLQQTNIIFFKKNSEKIDILFGLFIKRLLKPQNHELFCDSIGDKIKCSIAELKLVIMFYLIMFRGDLDHIRALGLV